MYLLEIKVIWGPMMISDALKRGWETLIYRTAEFN